MPGARTGVINTNPGRPANDAEGSDRPSGIRPGPVCLRSVKGVYPVAVGLGGVVGTALRANGGLDADTGPGSAGRRRNRLVGVRERITSGAARRAEGVDVGMGVPRIAYPVGMVKLVAGHDVVMVHIMRMVHPVRMVTLANPVRMPVIRNRVVVDG